MLLCLYEYHSHSDNSTLHQHPFHHGSWLKTLYWPLQDCGWLHSRRQNSCRLACLKTTRIFIDSRMLIVKVIHISSDRWKEHWEDCGYEAGGYWEENELNIWWKVTGTFSIRSILKSINSTGLDESCDERKFLQPTIRFLNTWRSLAYEYCEFRWGKCYDGSFGVKLYNTLK